MPDNIAHRGAADQSAFERFARDLYSIIAFFAANPHAPIPSGISLTAYLQDDAALRAAADLVGAETYGAHHFATTAISEARTPTDYHLVVKPVAVTFGTGNAVRFGDGGPE